MAQTNTSKYAKYYTILMKKMHLSMGDIANMEKYDELSLMKGRDNSMYWHFYDGNEEWALNTSNGKVIYDSDVIDDLLF